MKPPSSTSPSAANRLIGWGFAAVLLIRLAVFPFAKNFYGDPIMRLEALSAWLQHPYFLKSFIGAKQFGPLHLYLLAVGQWIHPDREDGPRLISLIFGSLTAFPLFRLAARRFGASAAFLSVLGLAIYPLHVQASTTAASEAVFLWFLLWALALLDVAADAEPNPDADSNPNRLPIVLAGLAMAGACAVRYDGWIYAPLSWLWLVKPLQEKRLRPGSALAYVTASLVVPVFLCIGNWIDLRSPFFVLKYVAANHIESAMGAATAMGRWVYAGYCLLFWPTNLAWELSPPIALGVAVALVAALREKHARDLLLLAAVPATLFSVEGVFLRFHPLARFTMPAALLLLPYAGDGLLRVTRWLPKRGRPAFAVLAVVTGLGLPSFFAWRTLGRGDSFANTLRPISPVSNLPPDLQGAADWLRANAVNRKVEVETNWLYEELPIAFYGRGVGETVVYSPRLGAPPLGFEPPDLLVLPKDPDVLKSGAAQLNGSMLSDSGQRYLIVAQIGEVRIFQRLNPTGNGY